MSAEPRRQIFLWAARASVLAFGIFAVLSLAFHAVSGSWPLPVSGAVHAVVIFIPFAFFAAALIYQVDAFERRYIRWLEERAAHEVLAELERRGLAPDPDADWQHRLGEELEAAAHRKAAGE